MINRIMESIGISLHAAFGDDYAIYTESVEQGLQEPCFFPSCIRSAVQLFPGDRFLMENMFCIQYIPVDKDREREECNAVAERLYPCLACIAVAGDVLRGVRRRHEVVDGVLHFYVNYSAFVCSPATLNAMEEVSECITVKG